jgi:hypothetical protein
MSFHELKFDSVAALADYMKRPVAKGVVEYATAPGRAEFFGTSTITECLDLARNGWTDGAKDAARALAARKVAAGAKTTTRRSVTRYDVSGDDCDVARFCTGDPENMTESRRVSVKGKTVRKVKLALRFACRVDMEKIKQYATACTAAVQRMENGGNRVELWVVSTCTTGSTGDAPTYSVAVKVKDASSRMHPAALAFACGHPSFYRRLIFGTMERHPSKDVQKLANDAYGRNANDPSPEYLTTATSFLYDADVEKAIADLDAAN